MKTLDKFDIILRDAKPSFVIMGNLDVTEYDFVSQDRLPASDEALDSYRQRGMGFLGVTGLVGGSPRTALAVPLDAPAIETLVTRSLRFSQRGCARAIPISRPFMNFGRFPTRAPSADISPRRTLMRKRFENLWAIRPEASLTVVRLMARDAVMAQDGGGEASVGVVAARDGKAGLFGSSSWEAAKPSVQGSGPNKIAIVPIQGVLTNDGPAYFGSNYQSIASAVERASADPDVKRIVLHVDSPGGEITGLPETAAVIAAAAKVKPVSAIVDGAAASAAYWLTSQASDITLTPSGEVGSVGVRMMHVDMSKMLDNEGYKVTELHAGEFKTEWSPYKPLSEEAQADMQTRLDASHAEFVRAVAKGRGGRASQAMVKSRFGEGRMHSSKEALAGGLVDKLQPARDFYRSLSATTASTPAATLGTRRARLQLQAARLRG
jgi:signal peptide peptidase SppA